ncbi:MAG: phospholipase [Boseongicola sp.]|nr:MAG: phospholipase [Boseongicola sp.]
MDPLHRNLAAVLITWIAASASPVVAQELPKRQSSIPETTDGVPHIQIGIKAVPELSEALLRRVEDYPGVELGATRVSLPGAVGFQIQQGVPIARPEVIVGGREFAHLHPDGSLHASLEPALARAAIDAGWAVAHPWANERAGWEGFVMIFTPQTQEELEVVLQLVEQSFEFVTGQSI